MLWSKIAGGTFILLLLLRACVTYCSNGQCTSHTHHLVIEISSVLPVVLITAVLSRWALPLHVIPQVVFKDAGEGYRWEHAHHWSQSQHQTHHDAGKIHCTDGIQGNWCEREKDFTGDQDKMIQACWVWFYLKYTSVSSFNFISFMLSTVKSLPVNAPMLCWSSSIAFLCNNTIFVLRSVVQCRS